MYLTDNLINPPKERIYFLYLLDLVHAAENKLWETQLPVPVSRKGRLCGSFLLYRRLCTLADKTLEALWKDRMAEKNPLTRFDARLASTKEQTEAAAELLAELKETDGRPLFTAAPLLSGRLDACADRFCAAFAEMLERIAQNRREICDAFFSGEDFGSITGWSAQMADLHFHGRSTLRVDTEKGSFYYKPRDCRTDVLFGQIVNRWFSDITRVPRCVPGPDYAFCQNISAAPASTEAEAGRYFRNLGGLCALFQMFGSSDLHSENLIAQGVYPVLVDMETILTPQPETFSDPWLFPEPEAKEDSFIYDLNHSLYPSSILPAMARGKQYSILLDTDEKTCQLPVVDGKKRTVIGFEEAFLEGFSEIYDRCVRLRKELLSAIRDLEPVPVRILLRQSAYYGKLLEALHAPSALRSEEGEGRIMERLYAYFKRHGAERLFSIADSEKASLLEGDIPYFYVLGGGKDLMADKKVVCRDFFRESGVENAALRLRRAGEAEKAFEMGLLRKSLEAAVIPIGEKAPKMEKKAPEHTGKGSGGWSRTEAAAEAEKIFCRVRDFSLRAPGGQVSWLMRRGEGDSFGPAVPVLFQGTAGLGVFFAAHAAQTAEEAQAAQTGQASRTAQAVRSEAAAGGRTREEAEQAARLCFEQINDAVHVFSRAACLPEMVFPAGLANGYAGVLLSLILMGRYLKDGRMTQTAREALSLAEKLPAETVMQSDVILGAAGLLLVLCRFEELYETPEGKRCIRAFADRLLSLKTLQRKEGPPLWDTLKLGRPVSGMGHGMAGIAAALSRAHGILGEEAYLAAAQDALDFEYEIYAPSLGTWPDLRRSARPVNAMHGYCSGAPGVGLAMLVCLENAGGGTQWKRKAEENLQRALASCLDQKTLFRDHLCCGNSAAAEFLLEAGGRLKRPELTARAGERLFSMKERAEKRGKYTLLPEGYAQAFDPSLFYGVSGIGYEMLRLAQPERIESLLV